ncbi:hypothetical protein Poli38472_007265 [Pythium oligandrum]|uniref:FYVE-type domain-containing protein n=1 Tax=Pythium oligandrum TaxID=41045 RepID=A0A8K1CA71_PYTOL|nr:hypothetical protein Poli38472_007265 [Pythium oligandrum]|eukprot:TMW59120.1 hypothetical protein Poli38472_007265 [Pythium oligandrum]
MPKLTASMMPQLRLTKEDERELRALGNELEAEALKSYEDFLYIHRRQIDKTRWKALKSHQDLHAYRERDDTKHIVHHIRPSKTNKNRAMEIGPQASLAANSGMPLGMITGTISGTVDEALYGTTFHSTGTLRQRNAYQKEHMEDSAVLSVIEPPSHEDPFQFMGILWYIKQLPLAARPRDVVVLSHVHQSQMSNGEFIGVSVYHSIQHQDLPELTDMSVVRSQTSLVTIFRQLDEERVDVFMTFFVDAMGNVPATMAMTEATKTFFAAANACETSFKKKLHWMMHDMRVQRQLSAMENDSDDSVCTLCCKSLTSVFSSGGCICQLCNKRVCSKCSMTKKIIIEATTTSIECKPVDFCHSCAMHAKSYPALDVAQQLLQAAERRRDYKVRQPEWSDASTVAMM